jgi:hypothetical protein
MKIKYVPLPNEKPDALLKEGVIYVVLEIFVGEEKTRYRIITDGTRTPTLHDARLFQIISPKIPSSWVVTSDKHKGFYIELAPAKWTVTGFWEKFFDGDSDAVAAFEQESYRIVTEED